MSNQEQTHSSYDSFLNKMLGFSQVLKPYTIARYLKEGKTICLAGYKIPENDIHTSIKKKIIEMGPHHYHVPRECH